MIAAVYGRISTDKQDTDNQLTQLRRFAADQGLKIALEFVDVITGGTSDRPQFQKMFEAAERGEFQILLFWSLDRLSREGVLPTLMHLERLTKLGVAYRSYTEQYLDSAGIFKDAIISIMATLARQEKIRIGERTRAGMARVKSQGKHIGRPSLQVSREEIARLRLSLSTAGTARQLRVSESTLRRRLRSP